MNTFKETLWKFIEDGSLTEYSLIVACVAVGNVAQLSCDLLISSLNMTKIASVYSSALIPVIGYDPFDFKSNKLSTSCEIYKSEAKKVVVLQLRAPVIYKYAREFLQDMVKTFKDRNVKEVIILTSSFAHEKKQILSSPFRFLANELSDRKAQAKAFNWQEHDNTQIHGGGFASMLYQICSENSVPCLLLYRYCSEGDNIPDAYGIIHYLNSLLLLFDEKSDLMSQLVQPISWKLMYGRPPPPEIY